MSSGAASLTNRHINSEREQKHTDPDNRMPAACPLNTGMIAARMAAIRRMTGCLMKTHPPPPHTLL